MQTSSQNMSLSDNQPIDSVEKTTAPEDTRADRSFDAIADHFEKKVYGGLKGEIRLAVLRRDIFEYSAQMSKTLGRPLRILDVGAGLAQIAIELAAQGHSVVINDISENMLEKAKAKAEQIDQELDITWYVCPYQALAKKLVKEVKVPSGHNPNDYIVERLKATSHDGKKIIWRAYYPQTDEEIKDYKSLINQSMIRPMNLQIRTMNSDGTNKKQITSTI